MTSWQLNDNPQLASIDLTCQFLCNPILIGQFPTLVKQKNMYNTFLNLFIAIDILLITVTLQQIKEGLVWPNALVEPVYPPCCHLHWNPQVAASHWSMDVRYVLQLISIQIPAQAAPKLTKLLGYSPRLFCTTKASQESMEVEASECATTCNVLKHMEQQVHWPLPRPRHPGRTEENHIVVRWGGVNWNK